MIPTLTANAYAQNGFYDYYNKQCGNECLSVTISQSVRLGEAGSENTVRTLTRLGYSTMNDYIIDYHLRTNPDFLESYHTIIVLHNEYVTQNIFDALQRHHNVIYLAPNALYGLVSMDGPIMRLERGHSYGTDENAFGWKYENSRLEYEKTCDAWKFNRITNGYQLNCNPETTIHRNHELLKELSRL